MRCQNAEKIETLIEAYNANNQVAADDKVEDYFIPSLAIRQRVIERSEIVDDPDFKDTKRGADEDRRSNELRSVLRHFVFLYARPSAFDRQEGHLPAQYWNVGKTQLHHYRNGSGKEITVNPEKMNVFISGCLQYLEKFEMRTREVDIVDGIHVTVRQGAFKDFPAEVYNVHYKSNGIRFSIAIKFFANDRYIHIHDCCPDDVLLPDQDSPVFSSDFIDRIQTDVLAILRRRVHRKEAAQMSKSDRQQLRQLYYLRHAMIDDTLGSVQLDALMSICASLSRNNQEKTKYNRILKQRIKHFRSLDDSRQNNIAIAYLLTALFISTRDANYRTEVKKLVMQQLPNYRPLREFLSIIREPRGKIK